MKNIWEKKIPTILAFIVLVGSIGATTLLVQSGVITIGKAAADKDPVGMVISDISESKAIIAFETREKTEAFVTFGTTTPQTIAFDEKDTTKNPQQYTTHRIILANLTQQTTYQFTITVDGKLYDNNGKPFTFKTGTPISTTTPHVISGKITTTENNSANQSLVVIEIDGAQKFTTVSDEKGQFTASLATIRNNTLTSVFTPLPTTLTTVTIYNGPLKTIAKTIYSKTEELPLLTLSKDYDFTTDLPTISDNQDTASYLKSLPIAPVTQDPGITFPQKNARLTDTKPVFKGTAYKNAKVKITIESTPQKAEVVADANGQWSYRPSNSLTPGTHTITIETTDKTGILKKIVQQFTVFAEGSQISEQATPSATLALPSPTRTVTVTISPSLSPTPTQLLTPTPTKTIKIITPTISTPTKFVTLPPSGDTTKAITVGGGFLLIIAIGAFILFAL